MGFWGKLGKGLLKIAPYAAMAIPGIGPIASMAIQGGLGAANAKASGGGWKSALLGAATGAAGAKMGGLGGAAKGLAPSKGLLSNIGNFAKQTGQNAIASKGGWKGALTSVLGGGGGEGEMGMGMEPAMQMGMAGDLTSGRTPIQRFANRVGRARGVSGLGEQMGGGGSYEGMMPGLGPVMGQRNQNSPNLAESIGAGRQDAMYGTRGGFGRRNPYAVPRQPRRRMAGA